MSDISLDMSELTELADLFEKAASRAPKAREEALDRAADRTFAEAHANASSYTKGTGALAETLTIEGTALTRRVGSPVREAWFLEVGSPNTGGPDLWLSGPAEAALGEMVGELADEAAPW